MLRLACESHEEYFSIIVAGAHACVCLCVLWFLTSVILRLFFLKAVGQGMPRPASCEKLSRQCGEKEKESESNLQPEHMKLLSEQPSPNNTSDQ